MRFKKGSKVEVLSKKEVSMGSWLCGEIISGNGHTYSVRYGWFPVTSEAEVERVPRKAIRPCPPPVERADSWVPGDHVEVFHNLSWKTATIVKDLGVNNFLVRLLGEFQEFKVHRSHLRVRQCWQDGKWFVVGKGSANCTVSSRKNSADMKSRQGVGEDCFPVKKNTGTLKRGSLSGLTHFEAHPVAVQKARAIEVDGSPQRELPRHPSPLFEKVDAHIFPLEKLGEKYMHTSFNIGTSAISEMDVDRGKENGLSDGFPSGTSTPLDTESSASSVASCNVNGYVFDKLPLYFVKHHSEDTDSHYSDAESFCGRGYGEEGWSLSENEELAAQVHRSELQAYRSIIEALYASGPLSWEDEGRVSDLRDALHITDDEYLVELRHLIAADARILTC